MDQNSSANIQANNNSISDNDYETCNNNPYYMRCCYNFKFFYKFLIVAKQHNEHFGKQEDYLCKMPYITYPDGLFCKIIFNYIKIIIYIIFLLK